MDIIGLGDSESSTGVTRAGVATSSSATRSVARLMTSAREAEPTEDSALRTLGGGLLPGGDDDEPTTAGRTTRSAARTATRSSLDDPRGTGGSASDAMSEVSEACLGATPAGSCRTTLDKYGWTIPLSVLLFGGCASSYRADGRLIAASLAGVAHHLLLVEAQK